MPRASLDLSLSEMLVPTLPAKPLSPLDLLVLLHLATVASNPEIAWILI